MTASFLPINSVPVNSVPVNSLLYGDNLRLLRSSLPTASVDLVYADPPFNSNRNYFVFLKDRTGKASAAQEEAFTDTWTWDEQSEVWYKHLLYDQQNGGLAVTVEALRRILKETPMMAYLVAMAIRFVEMHRVLKVTGSLYLHCDPTASHYLKIVLDVIFGPQNFTNEIIWQRTIAKALTRRVLPNNHDVILHYQKSPKATWNPEAMFIQYDLAALSEKTAGKYGHRDANGRLYQLDNLLNPNKNRPNLTYEFLGVTRVWRWTKARMEAAHAQGLVVQTKPGSVPRFKRYLDEQRGLPIGDVWVDIPPLNSQAKERLGYPTQKPLALLERIIAASSNPGDVVLDPFCGCGTAVAAAHKLRRQWIGMDVTAVAIDIIQTRMEQAYPDLLGKIPVIGFPQDLESAQRMSEADPYGFQDWACLRIGAHPRRHTGGTKNGAVKKGADGGVDGWLGFDDHDGSAHRAVVQVKGGKVQVSQVRDFCHVVAREGATLGFFVCLGDAGHPVTKPMKDEALRMGLWTSAGGRDYPRVQILSVAGLLERQEAPRLPPQDKRSVLGYKAAKQAGPTGQMSADDVLFAD